MGVYIKGIKKPKRCSECTIGECRVRLSKGDINYNVHPQCPLIEVKEPHGRLIDAEYLKEHLYQCETNGRPLHIMELNERLACISDVPTVIEAEGER